MRELLSWASGDLVDLGKFPWGNIGAASLVTMFVILLYTGRVISRASYEDVREQRDAFKTAWLESQQLVRELDQRIDANTDALRAVETALSELIHGERQR